jgi:RND family efflux transporter MFP subunit
MYCKRLGLVLVMSAAAVGCNNAPPALAPPKPPEVVVSRAVVHPVTDFEEFQGKTDANKTVDVRPRVTGKLLDFRFKEGAEVKEGDVIFDIVPGPFQAEFDRTKGMVNVARSHSDRLHRDYDRVTKSAPGSITDQEYNQVVGDYSEARGTLDAALASHEIARINLDYTKVTAPISGRISRRFVDKGNIVKADDTILTRIVNLDPIYVYFDIDERTYLKIQHFLQKRGISVADQQAMPARMELSDEHGFPNKGTIDFTDNRVDPDSGSVWLRGIFPNSRPSAGSANFVATAFGSRACATGGTPLAGLAQQLVGVGLCNSDAFPKEDAGLLTPGLFARIQLPIGEPHSATLIPEQALATDQGKKFVWVVNAENHAEYRSVELGAQHGQMRVVEKGIAEGDRVIVSGLQRVRSNPQKGYAEVNVTKEEPAPAIEE